MKKNSRIYARIDLDRLVRNADALHEKMYGDSKMICVIKADAYGHGALRVAQELENLEYVAGYAVATVEEALELRHNGIDKMIMILGFVFPEEYENIAKFDIRPVVFSYEQAKGLSDAAVKENKTISIHIKLDTGMNRIGYRLDEDYVGEIKKISLLPGIFIEGIFSHFYRADEKDKSFAMAQLLKFNSAVIKLREEGVNMPMPHIANSAAIMEFPDSHLALCRAGVALYGLWPSEEMNKEAIKLYPVMHLVSHISYIKTIKRGETIGYGGTFKAEKDMRIATVPVGYADGYPRNASNKFYVLINDKKANITGRVCMDQMMVDVSDIPEAEVGSKVILVGKEGENEITMEMLGEISGRFNYELVCDINKRVPRVYMKGGKPEEIEE